MFHDSDYRTIAMLSRKYKVGIIGSAGRTQQERKKMTKLLYGKMEEKLVDILQNQLKLTWDEVILVSGGAPWCGSYIKMLFM